jgi:protein-S-isoprenylcysteine O-methyltransferase Ste14
MIGWRIIFLLFSIGGFLSFTWAIKKHFRPNNQEKMPIGMRLISLFGLISFAVQIMAIWLKDEFHLISSLVGALSYLASLFLFYWAVKTTLEHRLTLAYSTDAPRFLLTTGPYGLIRHPFYSAYSVFWVAGFLATQQWWLLVPMTGMIWLYYQAAKMEEEKFSTSHILQKEFLEYRKQTGMFLPKVF